MNADADWRANQIARTIAETSAWCAPRADVAAPATCLRSTELAPPALADPAHAAARVGERRSFALLRAGVRATPGEGLAGGRLLAFAIDDTLTDGIAAQATGGYFDLDDLPPWDTWIVFVDERPGLGRYLVSWVPPQFIDIVNEAMPMCSTDFLLWVDETDTEFRRMLRRLGVM